MRQYLRKRTGMSYGISLFLIFSLTPFLFGHPHDNDVIRVGVYQNAPKVFRNSQGDVLGIFPDILGHIAEEEGWRIKWVPGTWKECLALLVAGKIDLMPDVAFSEERAKTMAFGEEVVFVNWGQLYTRPNLKLDSIIDLDGKKVAVMKGSIHTDGENGIKHLIEKFDINCDIIELDNYDQIFKYLHEGKADAGAVNRLFGSLNENRYKVKCSPIVFNPSQLHYATNSDDKGRHLLKRIDSYLKRMKRNPDSVLYQSLKNYLREKPEDWEHYSPVKALHLNADEKKWLKKHPTIKIGVDPNFPPFEMITKDNKYLGAAKDFSDLVAHKLGVVFVAPSETLSWVEAVEKAKRHELDVLPCVGVTKEREKEFLYSQPYLNFPRVIITRDGMRIENLDDLKDKRVAVQDKSSHHGFLKEKTTIKPVTVETFQEAMRKLSNGDVDAVIGNLAVATYIIRKFNLTNLTIVSHVSDKTFPLSFAIRRDWPILRDLINKALDTISEQEKKAIREKWFSVNQQVPILQESLRTKLTTKENHWLNDRKSIRIGLDPAYPPYCFIGDDGNYQGILPDLLDLLKARLDLTFKVVPGLDWAQVLRGVENRTLDVAVPVVETEKRLKYMCFSESVLSNPLIIMTRVDNWNIKKADDLARKKVAMVEGYYSTNIVKKDYPVIEAMIVKTPLEALRLVSKGKADAYVGLLGVSVYLANRDGISNLKIVSSYSDETIKQCFGVRRDWPECAAILNKALDEIPEERKIAIRSKWIPVSADLFRMTDVRQRLTTKERSWLREHHVVKVAVESDSAPLEFIDPSGAFSGIASEYLSFISRQLGIRFETVVRRDAHDVVELATKRQVDMLASVAETPVLSKSLAFTEPYLTIPIVVYTRRGVPYVGSLEELSGKTVAVVEDHAVDERIMTDHPNIILLKVGSIEQGFKAVEQGVATAFVNNLLTGGYYLRKLNYADVKVAGDTPYVHKLAMAVRGDWGIFRDILQKALNSIPEAERNAIYKRWISVTYEHGFDYSLLWKILVPLFALIALSAFWNQKLSKEVAQRTRAEEKLKRMNDELDERVKLRTDELKESHLALEQSERRYRLLFDSGRDSAFVFKLTRTGPTSILDCNQAACDLLGYTYQELTRKTIADIMNQDKFQLLREHLEQVAENEYSLIELEFVAKDKKIVYVELNVRIIELNEGPAALVIARDITQRIKAREQKAIEERRIRQSQKMEALGLLAGGIAHDFNNMLAGIMGYADLAKGKLPEDSQLHKFMAQILKASKRAVDLVKQILTFSRQIENERKPVEIKHILSEAVKLLQVTIPSSIIIKHRIKPDPGLVLADPTQIHQVVMNLCTNAYHAMELTGGILSIGLDDLGVDEPLRLKAFTLPVGHYVVLKIEDTGHGIPESVIDRIFEPYFSTKDKDKGTGLGLAVVHGIITNHEGFISVESVVGQGTTFTIYLPKVVGKDRGKEIAESTEEIQKGTETILLVDDDDIYLDMMREMLIDCGYQVLQTDDANKALRLFEEHKGMIDLVVTDMTMPGMNGLKLSERILNISPEIPIILATGFSDQINEERSHKAGIKAFIMKPVLKKEMVETIRDALAKSNKPPVS